MNNFTLYQFKKLIQNKHREYVHKLINTRNHVIS